MLTDEERKRNQRASIAKYNLKTKQFVMRFRQDADADVIERLESVPSKVGYVRGLIRRDMAKNG